MTELAPIASTLASIGEPAGTVAVTLSHELVGLLSEQLYQSPLKAIEELVVNAYDADAAECRLVVPQSIDEPQIVLVYDDGIGMDSAGLVDLWHIGRSNKRSEEVKLRAKRTQIGKFGIGKLATYAIANKVTYLTRRDNAILTVTLDFRDFGSDPSGAVSRVQLPVRRVPRASDLVADPLFKELCERAGVEIASLESSPSRSWTFSILEDLKSKPIQPGRLRWVLRTAMPLDPGFRLFLNGERVTSSKTDFTPIVQFDVGALPPDRLKSLKTSTGEKWTLVDKGIKASSFPSGVFGTVTVTAESLHAGKSSDIGRSHGFFIRVRDRLINEDDPLFGLRPLSYQTFNRFRADLEIDDLDEAITAPREGVSESLKKEQLEHLLNELFYAARDKYEEHLKNQQAVSDRQQEDERNYVNPRLVERPIADMLTIGGIADKGAEPDESWFYLDLDPGGDLSALVQSLYEEPRGHYTYKYTRAGKTNRLVRFNPIQSTFYINADHDLVQAYADDGRSKVLLEDLVTAEALLEVYLREHEVPAHQIGAVLERRDSLLRSLTKDHPFALESISAALRDATGNQHQLEVALVAAARALGFVAKHIGGAGEPDGLARLIDYPAGEQKITLEAKSSEGGEPGLPQLDFAGLAEHVKRTKSQGCLLIAPSYPGGTRGDNSAASSRATESRISCWTVEQLARVVAAAEARHFNARQVLDIVLNNFTPGDVEAAISALFASPAWEFTELYREVLKALEALEGRLPDSPRTIDLVAGEISRNPTFAAIRRDEVEKALRSLVNASQGLLTLSDDRILVHGSHEEVNRRLDGMTGDSGQPRRHGTFRDSFE
jgi:hypothetical protein